MKPMNKDQKHQKLHLTQRDTDDLGEKEGAKNAITAVKNIKQLMRQLKDKAVAAVQTDKTVDSMELQQEP